MAKNANMLGPLILLELAFFNTYTIIATAKLEGDPGKQIGKLLKRQT